MANAHFKLMVATSAGLVVTTAYLIFIESGSPGYCPPYPVIGTPTCIVVEVYFVLILLSLFGRNQLGDAIFWLATSAAFLTSVYLSVKEVLGLACCPRVFEIPLPLCFIVFPTMALLMYLRHRAPTIEPS